MVAPCSPSARARYSPFSSSTSAPIRRSPRTCCSTRRMPMSSPPGFATRASPRRASTVTSSGRTSRNPPETKNKSSFPSLRTFTVPGFSDVSSGICRGRIPSSPAAPGATTKSASPLKRRPSTVTMSTCSLFATLSLRLLRLLRLRLGPLILPLPLLLLGLRLRLLRLLLPAALASGRLHRLVDGSHHVEGLLGQLIVLAVQDLAKTSDRFLERHILPRPIGENLGDEEGLREEPLDLAGAGDQQLVILRQLIRTQDGDDVLKLLVSLQHLLHAARHAIVLVTDDV